MTINEQDKEFLHNFPKLKLKKKGAVLVGRLSFNASFDRRNKKYIIYDNKFDGIGVDNFIHDEYMIEINLSSSNIYRDVREIGNKIKEISQRKNKDCKDLHFNENSQKVCLMGYFDEREKISLMEFLGEVVIPFFYDVSFYDRCNTWPRGSYSHGYLGLLENYYDNIKKQEDDYDFNLSQKCIQFLEQEVNQTTLNKFRFFLNLKKIKECICGSKKKLGNCHCKATNGFVILKRNMNKFNLFFKDNSIIYGGQ
ncbi:hypothetical protein M0P25_04695 [archaeon]|nr:hypothetical protein [archaeon]MDD3940509.1 hypothetical protein [Candidatus Paceibacterota bacterium]